MDRCRNTIIPVGARVSLPDLHARVVDGDRAALEAIAEDVLPRLRRELRRAFRRIADDALQDAAEDAVMDYARCPQDFDASSDESLNQCLYRAAWRNVADSLDADVNRRKREVRYAKETVPQDTPEMSECSGSIEADLTRRILGLAINDAEREALGCWLTGERGTERLAQALGVAVLPILEQRRTVKRFKDRILKRIARDTSVTDRRP
jgi:RNA polymerase sigma-70 factor (ECF subfamily)